MANRRTQRDVRRDIDRLSLAGRKQNALTEPPTRRPLNGSLGVGRDSASTSDNQSASGIDYEAKTVTSTDGIFVFEIMVDSSLL
jgi:hypothetical protein